jgi:hypothetical protein
MKKLSLEIVKDLAKKLKLDQKTVKKNIYLLQKSYPSLTKNALAQIYATKKGGTVFRKLDKEDKATLPSTEVVPEKIKIKVKNGNRKLSIKKVLNYETTDHFKKGHIEELNKAYTFGCNTSVFILARKIVENLIIDILKKKYPERVKNNKELYFDTAQGRLKDFGIILRNLKDKKADFGSENRGVEKLCDLAKSLKDDANNKAHSWYHLVENKNEIDNLNLKTIIEIIKKLEKEVGIK